MASSTRKSLTNSDCNDHEWIGEKGSHEYWNKEVERFHDRKHGKGILSQDHHKRLCQRMIDK